jgi:hypothetical protein
MTDAYYGWFWVAGNCPEDLVAGLGGTYPTDDSVLANHDIKLVNLTADEIGFGNAQSTGTGLITSLTASCGYSLAADVTGY